MTLTSSRKGVVWGVARAGTRPINKWYSPIVRSYSVLWQKLLDKVRVAVLLVAAFFFPINFSLVCLLKTFLINGWFQFFSLTVSVACWGTCGESSKAREIGSRWAAAHVTLFSLARTATLRGIEMVRSWKYLRCGGFHLFISAIL